MKSFISLLTGSEVEHDDVITVRFAKAELVIVAPDILELDFVEEAGLPLMQDLLAQTTEYEHKCFSGSCDSLSKSRSSASVGKNSMTPALGVDESCFTQSLSSR